MPIEMSSDKAICFKCGTMYSRRKGYFSVSYSLLNKGLGYLPVCKTCVDNMYNEYLEKCGDAKTAVRQMCRKLDLYWSDVVFENVMKKSSTRSVMTQYIAKINTINFVGKDYDDTLAESGSLWKFDESSNGNISVINSNNKSEAENEDDEEVPTEIVQFWGKGYSNDMYRQLEQRREYWMSRLPNSDDIDVGTEALIRQICSLELDINRDRIEGKAVDKSVNALNNLLGSANLKPTQKKDDADSTMENTPFGVWIHKWENKRPIPEIDSELRDTDGIIKYILTWFYGHLAKMLGVKNAHSRLYDKEIEKLRVSHPEFEDEDDDDLLYDIFGDGDEEDSDPERVVS